MKLPQLIHFIKGYKKGTYTRMSWVTVLPAKDGHKVEKRSYGVVRLGIEYSHIKGVQTTGNALPGDDTWVSVWYPFLINSQKGDKLRVTKSGHKAHTTWFVDGKEVTKDQLRSMNLVAPSRLDPKPNPSPIFTVFVENIVSIG